MKFQTVVLQAGKTAGLQIPDELVEALASGSRSKVLVTVVRYRYRTPAAPTGGRLPTLGYQGSMVSPPHSSGATSAIVWENVQWCPQGSRMAHCRSPKANSVGSIRMVPP